MFTSWQTSLAGLAAIIVAGCVKLGYITAEQGATLSGVIVGIIGLLAKDRNVSGSKVAPYPGADTSDPKGGVNAPHFDH